MTRSELQGGQGEAPKVNRKQAGFWDDDGGGCELRSCVGLCLMDSKTPCAGWLGPFGVLCHSGPLGTAHRSGRQVIFSRTSVFKGISYHKPQSLP